MTHLLVHYHMRPGGVTRVILAEMAYYSQVIHNAALITSEPADSEIPTKIIDSLDYAKQTLVSEDAFFAQLLAAAEDFPKPWIWHVHNPTLGCHSLLTSCCQRLAEQNERLIYHIHDFAEDQRPANLKRLLEVERLLENQRLYPFSQRMHYCVLTGRDRDLLIAAGLPSEQVSVVPNPINANTLPLNDRLDSQVLYPTRAIDRKNIGEFLLMSALAPAGVRFSTTRGPGNSLHQQHYAEWLRFARELDLPVDFAIAETSPEIPLEHWIGQATHLCTTSAHEGFGMAYLESIAWQRPLLGRSIPHIKSDLEKMGIDHPALYDSLFSTLFPGIDFPQLNIEQQKQVIRLAKENPQTIRVHVKGTSQPASDWLRENLQRRSCPISLDKIAPYSIEQHGEILRRIVEHLAKQPASPCLYLDPNVIREFFAS